MRTFLIGIAAGLAALAGSTMGAMAAGPACQSITQVTNIAAVGTARHGGKVLNLDGRDAMRFVDYLNNHIGDPSLYRGDTLIIGLYPDLGYVLVGFATSGCVDQKNLIKLDPRSFIKAYTVARGVAA